MTGESAASVGAGGAVWWYWVRSRLTTTHYELANDSGEWVGKLDRGGWRGHRAQAEDAAGGCFRFALGRHGGAPRARIGRNVVAAISEGRLRVDGQWFDLWLPRDASFSCEVRRGDQVLLRVARASGGPFARVDIAAELRRPTLVALLALSVLTCDHDMAHTIPDGY